MNKKIDTKIGAAVLLAVAFFVAVVFVLIGGRINFSNGIYTSPVRPPDGVAPQPPAGDFTMAKFNSQEDFKDYLVRSQASATTFFKNVGFAPTSIERSFATDEFTAQFGAPGIALEPGGRDQRVSTTNVQVAGIDEPDIVKTDGKEIYFSKEGYGFFPGPMPEPRLPFFSDEGRTYPYPERKLETRLIKAFPPADLVEDANIEKSGNLLLSGKTLVILSDQERALYGYDIARPKSPKEAWRLKLGEKTSIVSARLFNEKIYLITTTSVNFNDPCPVVPLSSGATSISIPCTDIYHPSRPIPTDATYSAFVIDPATGRITNKVSFVGSPAKSVVYMSPNAIYITYGFEGDVVEFIVNFFTQEASDLIPTELTDQLKKLANYDLSASAKITELGVIFERFYSSLGEDERTLIENELTNRLGEYAKKHIRDLERTGIAKISLDDFSLVASADVPGQPLNQFSLDEYQGYLRFATTISGRMGFYLPGLRNSPESANDVYVLNDKLKIVGSVTDLGLDERIFSARFIEDKGYLVTFKQVDPFFVLDLSSPQDPKLTGELKIPGFSSYLHPINKDLIIGVGKERANVKISLFDVSRPDDPREVAKYELSEFWTEVQKTHRAFLIDKDNEIFFLPGSKGGYIFSYGSNSLELKKAVANVRARRAVYINNYLYVIGDDRIVVLDEKTWERISELIF